MPNDNRILFGSVTVFDIAKIAAVLLPSVSVEYLYEGFMSGQPQKRQGLQNFFSYYGFCRTFPADHFRKKKFLGRSIIYETTLEILSKSFQTLKNSFLAYWV